MNQVIAPNLQDKSAQAVVAEQLGASRVRGADRYRLIGSHQPVPQKRRLLPNHTVSKRQEARFLFSEQFAPPLNTLQAPAPVSNAAILDRAVESRFAYPLWQRVYRVTGRVSFSGRRERIFVNGSLFAPSTCEKRAPHHNSYQKTLALLRTVSGPRLHLDEALLLTHPYDHVYFHNYHDVMTRLVLADEIGLSRQIPVVVSEHWFKSAIGQHFLKSDLLSDRPVVVISAHQTLVCKTLWLLQAQQYCKRFLDRVAASFPEEKPAADFGERLILVRDKGTTASRSCDGMDELIAALKGEGFAPLDPATLTIPQQKWVFARASHVIGENGSSFTNIVHRQSGALEIDALMASAYTSVTFQALSRVYGFTHRAHVLPSVTEGKHVKAGLTPDVMRDILQRVKQPTRKYA